MKLLGQRLTARGLDRQVAAVQVRVAILNGRTALASPSQGPWDKSIWGKARTVRQMICATEASR